MSENLQKKYQFYLSSLPEDHLFKDIWLRNKDMITGGLAEFGKRDSLFYTSCQLVAVVLSGDEPDFNRMMQGLSAEKYAPGMYPRHPDEFDTSKDPYFPLVLALLLAAKRWPDNPHARPSLDEIIESIRRSGYTILNPDGSPSSHGDMKPFKPIFRAIEGKTSFGFWFNLLISPLFSRVLNAIRKSYYNNFMIAMQYLIFHYCIDGKFSRSMLRNSANRFANNNRNNPFFLMVRDLISSEKASRAQVEDILNEFPDDHLPNDLDPITHSDMIWVRDPRDWSKPKSKLEREYTGVDFMLLYQFYREHYLASS